MYLVIYGPEGSGKGTQAKLLSEELGIKVITSGDLVRKKARENGSELGKACREALRKAKYVDDKNMFKLWSSVLRQKSIKKGFILDGFPRNVSQARFLKDKLNSQNIKLDRVIYIDISQNESIKRLLKRRRKLFPGSSKTHDTEVKIKKRLEAYREKEKKLLSYYKKRQLLLMADGEQKVEEVFKDILKGLGAKK